MNTDQKIQCLQFAIDLEARQKVSLGRTSNSLITIEDYYKSFCGLISKIDFDNPDSLVDLVDDTSKLLSQ